MPTFERLARFDKDYATLSSDQKTAFKIAVRKGLRVKGVQGSPKVFEMTWGDDGRATFSLGESIRKGEAHVVWHRVGSHDVLG